VPRAKTTATTPEVEEAPALTVAGLLERIAAGDVDARQTLIAHIAHVGRRERAAGYSDGLAAQQ